MAGRGFATDSKQGLRVLTSNPISQPPLPDLTPEGEEWSQATRDWWATLGDYPLAVDWTAVEWSYHMDTAVVHHKFWTGGGVPYAAELRLRLAKIGATAEDRARLRITFAQADQAEAKPSTPVQSARERFSGLSVIPS